MRNRFRLVSVSCLALALAACGSGAEEGEDSAADSAVMEADEADAGPADTGDGAEADAVATDEAAAPDEAEGDADDVDAGEPAATASAAPTAVATMAAPPASFTTCAVCHSIEAGQNGIGPTLAGVVGRKAGGVAGFAYSAGMQGSDMTWNVDNLTRYLDNPNGVVAGTSMPDPNIDTAQARAIAEYLRTL